METQQEWVCVHKYNIHKYPSFKINLHTSEDQNHSVQYLHSVKHTKLGHEPYIARSVTNFHNFVHHQSYMNPNGRKKLWWIHKTNTHNTSSKIFLKYLSHWGNKERKMQEAVGPDNDGLWKRGWWQYDLNQWMAVARCRSKYVNNTFRECKNISTKSLDCTMRESLERSKMEVGLKATSQWSRKRLQNKEKWTIGRIWQGQHANHKDNNIK